MGNVWLLAILLVTTVAGVLLLLLRRRRRGILRGRHLDELRAEDRLPDDVSSALRRASKGARSED